MPVIFFLETVKKLPKSTRKYHKIGPCDVGTIFPSPWFVVLSVRDITQDITQ